MENKEDLTKVNKEEKSKVDVDITDKNIVDVEEDTNLEEVEVSDEKNIEDLDTVRADYENQLAELTDKHKRLMAEFDNYRKRNEKEKYEMFDIGITSAITKLLPVIDNFERGLSVVDNKDDAVYQGFVKVYEQLIEILSGMDIVAIEALGKEFDINLHNAVMHEEDDTKGANIVVEELQKGYKYKDKVLRHSMVKVVN